MLIRGQVVLSVSLLFLETAQINLAVPTRLEVLVHDDAGLNTNTLDQCLLKVRAILISAGATVEIRLCPNERSLPCEPSKDARFVDLRILPGASKIMKNVRRPPLGQSFPSETGGVYAKVYLESVQRQAEAAGVPWTTLLSYAAVHEIGHLLLGSNAHTLNGVMKSNWDASDMQGMFQNSVRFTREQQRIIASCCGGTKR
jgi:hypothetical protein